MKTTIAFDDYSSTELIMSHNLSEEIILKVA